MQLKNSVVSAALLASSAFASSYTPDYKLNAYWVRDSRSQIAFKHTH